MYRDPLSLRTILLSVLFIVIIALFLLIATLFYKQNEDVALRVAKQFEVTASTEVINEFENFLNNAENNLNALYQFIAGETVNLNSKEDILKLLSSLLYANPKIAALYLADFHGNFYMAKHMPDRSISLRYVYRTENSIISEWQHSNPEYRFRFPLFEETSLEEGYDPRKRPWYKNADKEYISWSEQYIFYSDKVTGITGTQRIILDNFECVISVDVTLNFLSEFIEELYFSNAGSILIIDDKKQVIANHDNFSITRKKNQIDLIPTITPLEDLFLSEEMKQTIIEIEKKMKAPSATSNSKNVFKILTDLFFPSAEFDSLESLNINAKTRADFFEFKKNRYIYTHTVFDNFEGIHWEIYFLILDKTLVGNFIATLKLGLLLLTAMFLFVVLFYSIFLRNISNRIENLSSLMNNIASLNLGRSYASTASLKIEELETMGEIYNRIIKSLTSFKKFIPEQVIQRSISKNIVITPFMEQKKNISVLFSDVVSFTSITETHTPFELSLALNIYFTELVAIIREESGIVDKFIGDAIMAFFGVYDEKKNHAENACMAALRMQSIHNTINQKIAEQCSITFKTRIGINTGPALVGVLGSETKLNYTALGDTVNVASRLESLNKTYNTSIIISEATMKMLGSGFQVNMLDSLQVKGKEAHTTIYQLYGYTKPRNPASKLIKDESLSHLTKNEMTRRNSLRQLIARKNETYSVETQKNKKQKAEQLRYDNIEADPFFQDKGNA